MIEMANGKVTSWKWISSSKIEVRVTVPYQKYKVIKVGRSHANHIYEFHEDSNGAESGSYSDQIGGYAKTPHRGDLYFKAEFYKKNTTNADHSDRSDDTVEVNVDTGGGKSK